MVEQVKTLIMFKPYVLNLGQDSVEKCVDIAKIERI